MATPTRTVHAINEALDILENALEPLFAKTLHETLENQDSLEQAKLCAMLPYIVDQLITIYLGSRGIDPNTHYVHNELERIKVYFHKIARTEDPTGSSMGRISDQTMQIDKDAASRFIKAALAEATRNEKQELQRLGIDGPTTSSQAAWKPRERGIDEQPPPSEGRTHTRSTRFEDNESGHSDSSSSVSGGELVTASTKPPTEVSKRKRPVMDPFAGYGESRSKKAKSTHVTSSAGIINVDGSNTPEMRTDAFSAPGSSTATPTPGQSSNASKNARKKAKKKARLQDAGSRDKTPETPIVIDSDGE